MKNAPSRIKIIVLGSTGIALCALLVACSHIVIESTSTGAIAIKSTSPDFALAGSNSQRVTINGSGFTPFTKAIFNGNSLATTFVNPQQLVIQLGASELSTPGIFSVNVTNGSGDSASGTFSVWNVLSSSTPNPVGYPPTWSYSVAPATNGDPEQIGFAPPGKQFDPNSEYAGDIIETILPNSTGSLDQYYNSVAPVNLLSNSESVTHYQINGSPAIKFVGVNGMIPTDVIAIQRGQDVIEISDVGQQHTNDGYLDDFATAVP